MKIVYIIFSISKMTGIERMFVSQLNYLAELKGYDATLLTYDQGNAPDGYPLSSKVRHIDYGIKTFHVYRYPHYVRPFVMWRWNRKLKRCIKESVESIIPDIVVCSSYETSEMQIVLSLRGVKRVVQVHSSFLQSGGVLRSHHIESSLKLCYKKFFTYHKVIRLVRQFDRIVTLTQGDACHWNSSRVVVIPNPLMIDTPVGFVQREKKVIAVGSLLLVKGFDMLLEAWRKICDSHPDWQLEITGEGVEEPYLRQQMQSLSRVQILPRTTDIASRYMSGEIYAMTSRYEGFGLVLLEAMSCGLAPVAFDCDFGPREIITDGHDGFMVPLGDIDMLAERLSYLMDHEDERRRISANAIEKSKHYLPQEIMPRFRQLYESLVEGGL